MGAFFFAVLGAFASLASADVKLYDYLCSSSCCGSVDECTAVTTSKQLKACLDDLDKKCDVTVSVNATATGTKNRVIFCVNSPVNLPVNLPKIFGLDLTDMWDPDMEFDFGEQTIRLVGLNITNPENCDWEWAVSPDDADLCSSGATNQIAATELHYDPESESFRAKLPPAGLAGTHKLQLRATGQGCTLGLDLATQTAEISEVHTSFNGHVDEDGANGQIATVAAAITIVGLFTTTYV